MGNGRALRWVGVGLVILAMAGCVVIPTEQAPATQGPTAPLNETPTPTEIQSTPTLAALPTDLPQPAETHTPENETPAEISVVTPWYLPQYQTPLTMPNFAHPESGCNWMGIAGQVFDTQGNPTRNILVNVGGVLNGKAVDMLSMTGLATNYGPAGYESVLANAVNANTGTLWVQLYDLSGNPLSDKVQIDTYADCQRNLTLVNFVLKAAPAGEYRIYLPVIYQQEW